MRLRVWICASALAVTPGLLAQERLTLADAVSEALAGNPQVVHRRGPRVRWRRVCATKPVLAQTRD